MALGEGVNIVEQCSSIPMMPKFEKKRILKEFSSCGGGLS